MQQDRLDTLIGHFADILPRMMNTYPADYAYDKAHVPGVVARIRRAIDTDGNVNGISLNSHTWHATCKALGIKCNRKAINAYLNGVEL